MCTSAVELTSRRCATLYAELGISNASVRPYIDDMPRALAEADLVIGRAGASAVAEICAVGRPSVLVPGAFGGDHQRHNAEALEAAGASVCVLNADASPARLAQEIERLASDRERSRSEWRRRPERQGRPQASSAIARDLLALAGLSRAGANAPPESASSSSPSVWLRTFASYRRTNVLRGRLPCLEVAFATFTSSASAGSG